MYTCALQYKAQFYFFGGNKMKRKIIALCVVVAMLAVAIIGGTLAYFTDTDEAVNVMTMGNVKIEQIEQQRDENGNLEDFEQGKPVFPAVGAIAWDDNGVDVNGAEYKVFDDGLKNVIDKIVTVKNTGKSDAYVRTIIALEAPDYDAKNLIHINYNSAGLEKTNWTPIDIDGVNYVYSVFTYNNALVPNEISAPSLMQVFLDSKATNEDVEPYGDTWDILVLSQAIQAEGFGNAKTALDEGFGVADGANVTTWFGGEEFTVPTLVDTAEELMDVLTSAGAANAGNSYIAITSDLDLTGETWTPIYVNGYHGADVITIDGGGNTIKGLTAPLFAGGFAGGSGIVIKDLTIADSNIVSTNTIGSGAFIDAVDSMAVITLENCHLVNSTVTGGAGSRTGGLIGWTAGYSNVNDGPVKTYVNIKNCSVIDSTITCDGSVGGIYGHAGNNDWTYSTIENCTVKGCTLNSTDDGGWRVGVVVGTANVGEVTIKNITESGNTLTQTGKTAPTGQSNLYGRFVPGTTGKLTIDGVAIQ